MFLKEVIEGLTPLFIEGNRMKLGKADLPKLKQLHVMLKEATYKDADFEGMIAYVKCLGWVETLIRDLTQEDKPAAGKPSKPNKNKKDKK